MRLHPYRSYYRRFFGWAEKRGLSLNDISASDAAEFVGECCLPATVSESAQINLSAIRSLFRHFASTGVLASNPLETPHSCKMSAAAGRRPRPSIPLAELKEMVLELDETYAEDEELFQAGLVMLSPLSLRTTDPEAIGRFTGVPLRLVREFAGRLLANDCWSANGKVVVDSDNPDLWGITLRLNVLIAAGMIERRSAAESDVAKGDG